MVQRLLGNERGTAVLLTLGFMIFLLAMVGFAVDLAYQMTVIGELERSMEAAALAGAGKLGFDDTVFPTARQFAQQYGQLNPQHNSPLGNLINLDLNPGNAPGGNIVLGVWDNNNFTPSLDGTVVNAVRCQFASQVQTTFLRVLGFQALPISASAIAVANPPVAPPVNGCVFPIGVGSCPFQGNTSLGCGAPITFITSSGKGDAGAGCLSPPCTNTSAWVNLEGGSANAGYLRNAITGAGAGNCPASTAQTGDQIPTSNGMVQSVMDTLEPIFVQKYNQSGIVEITDSGGNVRYSGKGWKVFIPVIQTDCPAGAISGSHNIVGWTEFVMAQLINKGQCAVNNSWAGNQWTTAGGGNGCTNPSPDNAMRAIFGYYSCKIIPANPSPAPGPRTALANRLRLVRMYQ
ncbi:MAG TPA: TadG family pilus assembly protein [Candidatus Acidoferrum sp.]|jgi:Flp pilus assembly protein TadG|nr:TadG family pilus assembly protein [Candidatus Acidoferrum sp.]